MKEPKYNKGDIVFSILGEIFLLKSVRFCESNNQNCYSTPCGCIDEDAIACKVDWLNLDLDILETKGYYNISIKKDKRLKELRNKVNKDLNK